MSEYLSHYRTEGEGEPREPVRHLTNDYEYTFTGLRGLTGTMRIRTFESEGQTPVVLATEPTDKRGAFTANALGYIACELLTTHFPKRLEEEEPCIWIEQETDPHYRKEFARVTFDSYKPCIVQESGRTRKRIGKPSWDFIDREAVEKLVGKLPDELLHERYRREVAERERHLAIEVFRKEFDVPDADS